MVRDRTGTSPADRAVIGARARCREITLIDVATVRVSGGRRSVDRNTPDFCFLRTDPRSFPRTFPSAEKSRARVRAPPRPSPSSGVSAAPGGPDELNPGTVTRRSR